MGLDDKRYALDPQGMWFDPALVEAAEHLYRTPRDPWPQESRPADTVRDANLALRFRNQDEDMRKLKRQVQIHGERQSDGSPTPEMLALMAAASRIVAANEETFSRRRIPGAIG